jgi:glutathione S-transferase
VQPPYAALNPNMLVPTLQDEDFILTENSAILKYLADAITIADYHAASYVALAEVDQQRPVGLSECRSIAAAHEGAEELATGLRGDRRFRRLGERQGHDRRLIAPGSAIASIPQPEIPS